MTNDKNLFERVRHEWILLKDLRVHPKVQRININEKWVNKIAENIDPDQYGELSVVEVPGRSYYHVFDGQHRMEAARKVWGDDQRVPCAVHEDCPLDRQAKRFWHNNARPVGALDRWGVRIIAKEEKVIAIQKVLDSHSLTVGKGVKQGQIMAVASVENVADRYGLDVLNRTLSILGGAWGKDPDGYDSLHIKGTAFLVHRFNGELNYQELVRRMAKSEGPVRLVGMARNYAEAAGISVERAMTEKLLQVYNKNRHKQLELR